VIQCYSAKNRGREYQAGGILTAKGAEVGMTKLIQKNGNIHESEEKDYNSKSDILK
jgi:hypothetical protein